MRKVPGTAMGAADQGRVRTASPRAAGFRTTLLPAPRHCLHRGPSLCGPMGHLMGTMAHSSGAPQLILVELHGSSH